MDSYSNWKLLFLTELRLLKKMRHLKFEHQYQEEQSWYTTDAVLCHIWDSEGYIEYRYFILLNIYLKSKLLENE